MIVILFNIFSLRRFCLTKFRGFLGHFQIHILLVLIAFVFSKYITFFSLQIFVSTSNIKYFTPNRLYIVLFMNTTSQCLKYTLLCNSFHNSFVDIGLKSPRSVYRAVLKFVSINICSPKYYIFNTYLTNVLRQRANIGHSHKNSALLQNNFFPFFF